MAIGSNSASFTDFQAQMHQQLENIFQLLNPKERNVLEKRFAITENNRSTLAEIGQNLNVTRERVRQIEKGALQKIRRNIQNYAIFEICEKAYEILKDEGGILREDLLVSKLLNKNLDNAFGMIQLVLSIDSRFERIPNTLKFFPHLRLTRITGDAVDKICAAVIANLKEKGEVQDVEKLHQVLSRDLPEAGIVDVAFLRSLFRIHKGLKLIDNRVGLIEWRNINPRTLRDKIYFILRDKKEPLHFVEISNLISGAQIDKKNVNLQAVHNELIRHDDFILIGRGIYALKEWGYRHGTVSDVIEAILKGAESMSEEDIIGEVLKKRQVKPITIILNLKNKSQFVRIGRKQYKLKTNV